MKEKSWLVEENFLDKGKFFACGKLPWWRKNLCLWKASLMKEKPSLVESFLDEQNIFAWGKLPLWRKNLWLCKTFLMKENSWLVEKFCYCGKIIALSLLKMKPSNKTNAGVETKYLFLNQEQKLNLLVFLSWTDSLLYMLIYLMYLVCFWCIWWYMLWYIEWYAWLYLKVADIFDDIFDRSLTIFDIFQNHSTHNFGVHPRHLRGNGL